MNHILAIDAGNTRTKWGLHDGNSWLRQGAAENARVAALGAEWESLPEPAQIVVSNVGGENLAASLTRHFSRWRAAPTWVMPVSEQCGVRNGYANPQQLGSDRWAAVIAAWNFERRCCLVVSLGTAMTVDALANDGVFVGGIIVPGLALMQAALEANTAALKRQQGAFRAFPGNTADAIYSGAVQALGGAVERMGGAVRAAVHSDPVCVLTGGAAELLLPHLSLRAKRVDNLVLEGLVLIAREQP